MTENYCLLTKLVAPFRNDDILTYDRLRKAATSSVKTLNYGRNVNVDTVRYVMEYYVRDDAKQKKCPAQ